MGMNVYVSGPTGSGWTIAPRDFERALVQRWPSAKVKSVADPARWASVRFELMGSDGLLTGELSRQGDALVVDHGSVEDIAEVVIWVRSLGPASQPLVMVSGPGHYCELSEKTTVQDVLHAFD